MDILQNQKTQNDMSDETKEPIIVPTDAELAAAGPVAHSPEEAEKMLREDKAKAKKTKPKSPAAAATGALKAIGLAACKRHGLKAVWVTDDGQCFDQENNARAHGKNLDNPEPLKVEA